MPREAIERDEFRTPVSPSGLRVVQVTSDEKRDSSVACQYIIRWTSDSKRLLFFRSASEDGSSPAGIWLCDTEDQFAVRPVYEWDTTLLSHTNYGDDIVGKIGDTFVVNADGRSIMVMQRVKDVLELCRVSIETGQAEAVTTAPAPIATGWMLDVSANGKHVAFHVFMGDGKTEGAPWGMRVFDLERDSSWIVEMDNKSHKGAQYRRGSNFCSEAEHAGVYDMLTRIGGSARLADGSWRTPPDGAWRQDMPPEDHSQGWGHTLVFRDDGTDFPRTEADACRVVPLPRSPLFIASHAGWRGREARSFVASMYNVTPERWRAPFIEAEPAPISPDDRQADRNPPGAEWTDLTRFVSRADACHFDFDASGRHLVSDTDGYVLPGACMLYVGTYVEPENGEAPYLKTRLLGIPRTSWKSQPAHPHPFLSPDGKYAVFQSDFSGRPQIHLAYDFGYP